MDQRVEDFFFKWPREVKYSSTALPMIQERLLSSFLAASLSDFSRLGVVTKDINLFFDSFFMGNIIALDINY